MVFTRKDGDFHGRAVSLPEVFFFFSFVGVAHFSSCQISTESRRLLVWSAWMESCLVSTAKFFGPRKNASFIRKKGGPDVTPLK